jgi:hypothetical protein
LVAETANFKRSGQILPSTAFAVFVEKLFVVENSSPPQPITNTTSKPRTKQQKSSTILRFGGLVSGFGYLVFGISGIGQEKTEDLEPEAKNRSKIANLKSKIL